MRSAERDRSAAAEGQRAGEMRHVPYSTVVGTVRTRVTRGRDGSERSVR